MIPFRKLTSVGLAAAAAIVVSFAAAKAQLASDEGQIPATCLAHDELADSLERNFQERQAGYGRAGEAAIMEVFASEGGTWTMVLTDASGISCIVAAGDGWESAIDTAQGA